MNTSAVKGRHTALGCSWIVVLNEAVIETLGLELKKKSALMNSEGRANDQVKVESGDWTKAWRNRIPA